jgi:hypothetical protein
VDKTQLLALVVAEEELVALALPEPERVALQVALELVAQALPAKAATTDSLLSGEVAVELGLAPPMPTSLGLAPPFTAEAAAGWLVVEIMQPVLLAAQAERGRRAAVELAAQRELMERQEPMPARSIRPVLVVVEQVAKTLPGTALLVALEAFLAAVAAVAALAATQVTRAEMAAMAAMVASSSSPTSDLCHTLIRRPTNTRLAARFRPGRAGRRRPSSSSTTCVLPAGTLRNTSRRIASARTR